MFVPGVNGSIIANSNAPSGSRLKGAYKNSKKRKAEDGMVSQKPKPKPNGGSVDIMSTLKELDPNFNKPKNTVNPLVKDALASANVATGMLSLGHFSPDPLAQTAAFVGDISGALVDVAQSGVDLYEGDNVNAAANVGTAITPLALKNKGYYRSRSLVGGTSPGKYRPISPLNTTQGANPAIKKGLNWNKAILAANVIDMGQNISSSNNATMRVPQRDNTQVIMRPNPNRPIMPNGGSVLSKDDYDLTTAPKRGDYLLPDINRPYYIDDAGERRSEYKIGINVKGKETLIPTVVNGRQLTNDEAVDRYRSTGLHMGQFNTPKEADYAARLRTARYNMLDNPIKFQANQFKDGGETDHDDDKDMVNGVASILRRVKDKKNRLQLANQLSKQFDREKVKYDLPSFLAKSKVKK